MKITAEANKNHEELWPEGEFDMRKTDPDLVEIFTNFAFDDVITAAPLDVKVRLTVILGAAIASDTISIYRLMAIAALNVGISQVTIKEILYQAVPYIGMSRVVEFLSATNEVFGEWGIDLPIERQSTTERETRAEKGLAAQKAIFGDVIDKMYASAPKGQLHIQEFLSANCFGDFYTRTGLDLKTRELLTYVFLISMTGVEGQVKAHIQGNVNVGHSKELLVAVTTNLLPYIGYPRTLNALRLLNEVIPAE